MARPLEQVLAERIRALADERGLPISHLADRAGMARSYLWRLLAADSSATLDAVQRLAAVLDVAPLELLHPPQAAHQRAAERALPRATRPKPGATKRR